MYTILLIYQTVYADSHGPFQNWPNESFLYEATHMTWLILLQPLWWRCVHCVIHHERDVREE